jgi:hypothetical protein
MQKVKRVKLRYGSNLPEDVNIWKMGLAMNWMLLVNKFSVSPNPRFSVSPHHRIPAYCITEIKMIA